MSTCKTEVQFVVIIYIPVQTCHNLISRSFDRISLILSRIITIFINEIVTDFIHFANSRTINIRCVRSPVIAVALTCTCFRSCRYIIFILTVYKEKQLIFYNSTTKAGTIKIVLRFLTYQIQIAYFVTFQVLISQISISCSIEIICTTLGYGIDCSTNKSALTNVKRSNRYSDLFQSIQRNRRTATGQVRSNTESIAESSTIDCD